MINRFQTHGQSLELDDNHLRVLTRTVLLGGELVDGRQDRRHVDAFVLCVEYSEYGHRIVVDALNEQERTDSEGGCHDVCGARLTTLDENLKLVVVGIIVIVVAGSDG
jgi:hypothetical protein